jgi:hypothetical protein
VLAEVWILTVFLTFLKDSPTRCMVTLVAGMKDLPPAAAVVLLALTYAVGWIINFLAAGIFKNSFNRELRDPMFGSPKKYEEARALVFQHGSSEALQDLQLDRHVIRIARSNVLNFSLFVIAIVFREWWVGHSIPALVVAGTTLFLAIVSYFQWRERYKGLYRRLSGIEDVIRRDQATAAARHRG